MIERLLGGQEQMMAEMRADDEKMMAKLDVHHERTMGCQETMEARLECREPTSEEHREVLKGRAAMETGIAPSKRHRGRNLAAGRRGEPKELTRGDCGSRRKLAAACRKVSRRARGTSSGTSGPGPRLSEQPGEWGRSRRIYGRTMKQEAEQRIKAASGRCT
jgi:hypothetical protein